MPELFWKDGLKILHLPSGFSESADDESKVFAQDSLSTADFDLGYYHEPTSSLTEGVSSPEFAVKDNRKVFPRKGVSG